jgi:hypothetical protein
MPHKMVSKMASWMKMYCSWKEIIYFKNNSKKLHYEIIKLLSIPKFAPYSFFVLASHTLLRKHQLNRWHLFPIYQGSYRWQERRQFCLHQRCKLKQKIISLQNLTVRWCIFERVYTNRTCNVRQ